MKKAFLVSFFIAAATMLPAQKNMYVWQGNIPTEFAVASVDSVTFADALPEPEPEPKPLPELLSGIFSVSATKQIQFSRGNLQYTFPTDADGEGTWAFAEQQYDVIGTDNVTGGEVTSDTYGYYRYGDALAGTIDLFGWSGSTATVEWGIGTSTDYADYSGDFKDWGQNIGDGSTWHTLSENEWIYLFQTRENAGALYGAARINLNEDGSKYANGMILLPDVWQTPDDVTFLTGFSTSTWNNVENYGNKQTFNLSEWQSLEAAGAVFLPATGSREGASVEWVHSYCGYWSSTPYFKSHAYRPCFDSYQLDLQRYIERYRGFPVRLVQEVR